MRDQINLINDRLVNFRIRMANTDGQYAAEAIEVFVALIIPHMKALAFHERERLLIVGSDGREEKLFVLANTFGRCRFGFSSTHFRSFGPRMPRSLQIFSI